MAGSLYQTVFGGNVVAPALPTYLALNISVSVILGWPLESNITAPATAAIIDVSATVGGLTLQLSDARAVGTGYCALFNNVGANTVSVLDAQGNLLMTPASGQAWQLYLADNSTVQGTWRVFQYGASVSTANAATLAGNGLKAISTTLNERIVINPQTVSYAILTSDRAACVEWTGGSGGVFTAPSPVVVGSDWFCYIKNSGTGVLTLSASVGSIDGSPNKSFNPNDSCVLVSDGTNLFTMGFGQSVSSIFSFVTISVAGATGNVVLSGAQLNRVSYRFTGALAGNVVIVVPNAIQQYWVDNETTGAFTLTVSTALGTGVVIAQGGRNILYCDGTNVTNAVTFGSTGFPAGTAVLPGVFFSADTGTGVYLPAAHTIGLAANSTEVFQSSVAATKAYGPQAAALVDMTPDTGSFTLTGVGFSGTAPTIAVVYNRSGNTVVLRFDSAGVNAPSNSTGFSFTGLPVFLQPVVAATQTQSVNAINNGGAVFTASVSVGTFYGAGVVAMLLNSLLTGWNPTGNKGFGAVVFTYLLN